MRYYKLLYIPSGTYYKDYCYRKQPKQESDAIFQDQEKPDDKESFLMAILQLLKEKKIPNTAKLNGMPEGCDISENEFEWVEFND